jgi:hypothetical protein
LKQADRVEELQALHVAAEIVDQRLRDVEQRRDGCCAQNMRPTNRQRAGTPSAIATLMPGLASSMLSTRLPSLGSGPAAESAQTHAMLEVAQKAPPHTRRLIARVKQHQRPRCFLLETGEAARLQHALHRLDAVSEKCVRRRVEGHTRRH